jgi:hypothetical protein
MMATGVVDGDFILWSLLRDILKPSFWEMCKCAGCAVEACATVPADRSQDLNLEQDWL